MLSLFHCRSRPSCHPDERSPSLFVIPAKGAFQKGVEVDGWRKFLSVIRHERSEEGSPQSPDWWGDPSRRCRDTQDDKKGPTPAKSNSKDFLEGPFRRFPKSRDAINRVSTRVEQAEMDSRRSLPLAPNRGGNDKMGAVGRTKRKLVFANGY
ncbi:MAG: hypothetical protein AAF471_05410 [Myxococcota bacterium]